MHSPERTARPYISTRKFSQPDIHYEARRVSHRAQLQRKIKGCVSKTQERKVPEMKEKGIIVFVIALFYLGGGSMPARADSFDLKQACIQAAIRGIELEIERYQGWIDLRKQGTVDASNLPELEAELKALNKELEAYQALRPEDYTLPEKIQTTCWVEDQAAENSILYVEGMSRSGPWYHLAGIAGNDFGALKPHVKYTATIYLVYPRSYFYMTSAYVYVAELKKAK